MQYFRQLSQVPASAPASVVTIGNFDGIHLGHQSLIQVVLQVAQAENLMSWLVSFEPLPHAFFAKQKFARLMSWREKYHAVKGQGLDAFLTIPFTPAFAQLSAENFIQQVLVNTLNARVVVVGDDFQFGRQRQGDANLLRRLAKQHGYRVIEMPTLTRDGGRVSTTRIRAALAQADFALAERLLGRPYQVTGCVTYGNQIGRTLGFPTANIALRRRLIPLSGVYAAWVDYQGQRYKGAVHVGPRPVLGDEQPVLEVFLLDFDGDLYSHRLSVTLVDKVRDVTHFDSLAALTAAISADVGYVRNSLK
jgi:riboflavin kinase/FMN adenylyltransferase